MKLTIERRKFAKPPSARSQTIPSEGIFGAGQIVLAQSFEIAFSASAIWVGAVYAK